MFLFFAKMNQVEETDGAVLQTLFSVGKCHSIYIDRRGKKTTFYIVNQEEQKIVPLRLPNFIKPVFRSSNIRLPQTATGPCHIECEMPNNILIVLAFTPGTRKNSISLHILGCQFKACKFYDPCYTTEIYCPFNHRDCTCETKLLRAICNSTDTSGMFPVNLFLFVETVD